jgi:hypothetical protein
MAVQFKYNDVMKRYDVLLPFTLADESSELVVASISEDDRLTLHRELRLEIVKQIVLRWDEYSHQIAKEMEDVLNTKPE